MKKTAFNMNILYILLFAILAVLAHSVEIKIATKFLVLCSLVLLVFLPACSKKQ